MLWMGISTISNTEHISQQYTTTCVSQQQLSKQVMYSQHSTISKDGMYLVLRWFAKTATEHRQCAMHVLQALPMIFTYIIMTDTCRRFTGAALEELTERAAKSTLAAKTRNDYGIVIRVFKVCTFLQLNHNRPAHASRQARQCGRATCVHDDCSNEHLTYFAMA